jgi:predicted nucleotidyltransferase
VATKKYNKEERLERRNAIMRTLYFNKGWATATQIAATLKLKPVSLGSMLKRMAKNGDEIEMSVDMVSEGAQRRQRFRYKLTYKARQRWGRQLTQTERTSDNAKGKRGGRKKTG